MKILIGYDGSDCAQAALSDLPRAGLPAEAEAAVLTSIDPWSIAATDPGFANPVLGELAMSAQAAVEASGAATQHAEQEAENACERVRGMFPRWKVSSSTSLESPSSAILHHADEWRSDLIVIGSHGRGALRRLVLGSVSQSVLTHAHCSVRLGRGIKAVASAPRLIVGIDGSAGSDAAVAAIAGRSWPAGTRVLAIAVIDLRVMMAEAGLSEAWDAGTAATEAREWTQSAVDAAAATLRGAGLDASAAVHSGDPKSVLIAEADRWGADCIFVGARGRSRVERLLVGSVSTAVAERARCSVEVVKRGA